MPTRTVTLTPEQDAFVDEALRAGDYRDAGEVVREAFRMLGERRLSEQEGIEALRRELDIGLADLERGDYVEVRGEDLADYLDSLASRPAAPSRR